MCPTCEQLLELSDAPVADRIRAFIKIPSQIASSSNRFRRDRQPLKTAGGARRAIAASRRRVKPLPRLPPPRLYAAGVDYDDIVATLEREGIEKFVASVERLLDGIRAKRRALTAAA